eukprot:s650_g2.t1
MECLYINYAQGAKNAVTADISQMDTTFKIAMFGQVVLDADSGAGGGGSAQGAAAAAAAHAAAAAAAAISALGAPLDPSGAQRLECDALRVQIKEQDSELRAAKQREEELRRELEELRAERRGLLHSASEAQPVEPHTLVT